MHLQSGSVGSTSHFDVCCIFRFSLRHGRSSAPHRGRLRCRRGGGRWHWTSRNALVAKPFSELLGQPVVVEKRGEAVGRPRPKPWQRPEGCLHALMMVKRARGLGCGYKTLRDVTECRFQMVSMVEPRLVW